MAETVTMPKLGFDMAEGTLVRWVVQEGEPVAKGVVIAEIETDKATVEVESTFDGIMGRHLVSAGDIVPINTPIAIIAAPGEKLEAGPPAAQKQAPPLKPEVEAQKQPVHSQQAAPEAGNLPDGVRASPLARRLAQERGVPLDSIGGTGPGGRIIRKDIEAFSGEKVTAAPPAAPLLASPKAATVKSGSVLPSLSQGMLSAAPPDETIQLNRLRAAIGRRMVEAKQQVPHFYVTREFDMAACMDLRKSVNAMLPDDEKLSVNDFVLKAAALALRVYPNLNATFLGDKILKHGQVNIGVAVAVEGGLLTVVNRDTDRKPVRQIAVEVRSLVARAREGKVRPDDIDGSTFSVSNLGMFDVEHFVAIINPPEAAILAVGAVKETPVVKDGMVQPGLRMKATISVDHRVSDGAEAARFLQTLAQYLEQPLRLLL